MTKSVIIFMFKSLFKVKKVLYDMIKGVRLFEQLSICDKK